MFGTPKLTLHRVEIAMRLQEVPTLLTESGLENRYEHKHPNALNSGVAFLSVCVNRIPNSNSFQRRCEYVFLAQHPHILLTDLPAYQV